MDRGKSIGQQLAATKLKQELVRREREEELLFNAWREVSGPECAIHTVLLRFRDGVLEVTVDSPAWYQELMLRDNDAVAGAMARATGLNVVKMRIRAGAR